MNNNNNENGAAIWEAAVQAMGSKMSKPSFETWILSLEPAGIDADRLILKAPNEFTRDWINVHYLGIIETAVSDAAGVPFHIEMVLPGAPSTLAGKDRRHEEMPMPNLNPRYTFDTFVIGESNRLAHAASLAVAESPARAYNPLFIYGGVGLGKTHLMHAIGHYVLLHNPSARVVYISSEKFTNEFINSIQYSRTEEFRNKYRTVDVLLVDDIQFLAGKEQTQEEFFHTFNDLHEKNKQIILSSDRPPREIATLEDRLRSRFQWGLTTDIQPPDYETRVAILRKKSESEHLAVPQPVILYLANRVNSNIRELEGALIKVAAYANFNHSDLTTELVDQVLKDMLPRDKDIPISITEIQDKVARHFNLDSGDMRAKSRAQNIAYPRQLAMFLCRQLTDASLPKIGQEFGGRDHTTVLHACSKIEEERATSPDLDRLLNSLTQSIKKDHSG
jgi:chromosomal replication initiator protein